MISWRTALWGNTEEVRFLLSGEDKAEGGPLLRFQYLKGSSKEGRGFLFTVNHKEKTRGNG